MSAFVDDLSGEWIVKECAARGIPINTQEDLENAIGIADRVGSIEVGKQADFQVVDVPNHRHLTYRFGVNRCVAVIKRGWLVARDGVRVDPGGSPEIRTGQ